MNTLKNLKANGADGIASRKTLKSPNEEKKIVRSLENPDYKFGQTEFGTEQQLIIDEITQAEETASKTESSNQIPLSYSEPQKQNKQEKLVLRDKRLLSTDKWSTRNGHIFTYVGIFLFTSIVYFRPYDLIPALSGFRSMASIIAVATIFIFLASQLPTGKLLTVFSIEVKCVLFMFFSAIITMPLAVSPEMSWMLFSDKFSKVALIFIIMVNALQTLPRLKGLIWLGIGAGIMVSYQAIEFYQQGVFKTEGYRVSVDYEGMFGNANDMALHLVLFTPIAVALGIASKNKLSKLMYFASAGLMVAGNLVTQSRGGGLGLIAVAVFLVWKLGKEQRFKVTAISLVVGLLILIFAPGNYGVRMLSIFVPGLDAVGSSDQRTELLKQSIIVTLRNPIGIGYGNFPIIGLANRETHNAYTQVSAELGWLPFVAYLILIVSPFRKLAAIDRRMFADKDFSWIYYLSIGIQASLVGFMVSSFFGSVAYNWFVYYPIAYAISLRRIYQIGESSSNTET
jgi:O-antigen ligase